MLKHRRRQREAQIETMGRLLQIITLINEMRTRVQDITTTELITSKKKLKRDSEISQN